MGRGRFFDFTWRAAKVLSLSVVFAVVTLVLGQRALLYHPTRDKVDWESDRLAAESGFEPWRNEDGLQIGYKSESAENQGKVSTFLIFHGNAGRAADRTFYANIFREALPGTGVSVYILEYPGYGGKEGSPTQNSLLAEAEVAIKNCGGSGPLILLGESLGSGVACAMGEKYPDKVDAMILVTPYDRLSGVAEYHFPLLPVEACMFDKYPALDWLRGFGGRVGIVIAGGDTVIPPKFGRSLHGGFSGEKKLVVIEGADHNDAVVMMKPGEWENLVSFVSGGGGS